jgi:2-dehydropantoate 2-reductase
MSNYGPWRAKRLAVIGAGAMGTSFAAIAGTKAPVVMVCRNPERAAQIFRDGVRTVGFIERSAHPIVVSRAEDLASIGGVSAIFVATKTTSIPQVAADLRPLLPRLADQDAGLFVVSYQNGIEPGRQLMEMLGDPRVLRMVLNIGASMDRKTGVVNIKLQSPPHAIGTVRPEYAHVCESIAKLLTECGMDTRYVEDIEPLVWNKGVINAAMNPVAALVNSTVGEAMHAPSRRIVDALLREGEAVAKAEGIDLGADFVDRAHAMLEAGGEHTPSMVEDIRAGRESEIGQLNSQIIEHAKKVGAKTPTHEIVDALIETFDWKVYLTGRAGGDVD